eukprot:2889344-Heterocapsa_arctica.AAC.1
MGVETNKLVQMKAAAKAFENLPGYEERLEELRKEIKYQQRLSNQEGHVTRENQGTILLKQVTYKTKLNT